MANIFAPGPKTDRLTYTVTKKMADEDVLSRGIDSTTQVLTSIHHSLDTIQRRRATQGQAESGFLTAGTKGASDKDLAQTKMALKKGIDETGKLMGRPEDTMTETPGYR